MIGHKIKLALAVSCLFLLGGGTGAQAALEATGEQAIVVTQTKGFAATLVRYEKQNGVFRAVGRPMPAVLGKNGVAAQGDKKEGDKKTPAGTYSLSLAFGQAPVKGLKIPWKTATKSDFWVDDPKADEYNRWVTLEKGEKPRWRSAEKLYTKAYEYALVIDYNTDPVENGKGSAIFVHVWAGSRTATSGCVALSKSNMLTLLRWLDAEKSPSITIVAK